MADGIIRTTNVRSQVREHFDCPTADGAPLENQGGAGTAASHWEETSFFSEVCPCLVVMLLASCLLSASELVNVHNIFGVILFFTLPTRVWIAPAGNLQYLRSKHFAATAMVLLTVSDISCVLCCKRQRTSFNAGG